MRHVLHIGIDGLNPCFVDAPAPNIITRLSDNGAWTLNGRTLLQSWSAPCWTGVLCGTPHETSGVLNNAWLPPWKGYDDRRITPASGADVPLHCIFDVLKKQDKNIRTAAFNQWDWFQWLTISATAGSMDYDVYCEPPEPVVKIQCDNDTIAVASEYIRDVLDAADRSYTFVYLMSVDEAGHGYSWCSDEYMHQTRVVDQLVGELLDVIDDKNMQDDVMVVLTTDHGGHSRTHGTHRDDDLIIPMFIRGPGIKKNYEMEHEVRNIDVTATIARAMGYRSSVWWKGITLDQIFEEELP